MLKEFEYKLGNMKKSQKFIVYSQGTCSDDLVFQSNKSIGKFNIVTGKGVLNTQGCYFVHLNPLLGAKLFTFPLEFIKLCIENQPKKGDLIGSSPETNKIYQG